MRFADPYGLGPWDKLHGFPKEFWRWFHKEENGKLMKELKDPKTGQVPKESAEPYYEIWKKEKGAADSSLLEILTPWWAMPRELNSNEDAELARRRNMCPR